MDAGSSNYGQSQGFKQGVAKIYNDIVLHKPARAHSFKGAAALRAYNLFQVLIPFTTPSSNSLDECCTEYLLDQLEALEQPHDLENAQNLDDSQHSLVSYRIHLAALQALLRIVSN